MSRLTSLSPAALKAFFSPESDDTLVTLITISEYGDPSTAVPAIRIADNFTCRLDSYTLGTSSLDPDQDVLYGITNAGSYSTGSATGWPSTATTQLTNSNFLFFPVNVTLPSEEDQGNMPRCTMTINDVTRYLTPIIRASIKRPPKLLMELVLKSTPYRVEASFPGFYINSITYNANSVQFDISMLNYQREPFPCFTFTPKYFPGLF